MSPAQERSNLAERLRAFHKKHGDKIGLTALAEFVADSIHSALQDAAAHDQNLHSELQALAKYIEAAKSEISALRPDDVKTDLLPSASDELDAIIQATENATHEIMGATEAIDEIAVAAGGDIEEKLGGETVRIYQACGFQDITGQRIGKVVKALHHIEQKVDALLEAFGDMPSEPGRKTPANGEKKNKAMSDDELLEGPQMPDDAIKQDEVDALLASFD